ncbi:MAG: GTPase Era [Lachnospiraceae bacterium]|nr:GTPase Era [Lachnospiraceae bacterium]
MENENTDFRAGYVTIIGRPNVGKSTLMNALIGMDIAITSNKPQTTRRQMRTVLTTDDGQIVFVDTPGIHKAKNALGEYMDQAAVSSLEGVDLALFLVEPSTFIGAGEQHIIDVLSKSGINVILVINKTDTVKPAGLLPVIAAYKDKLDFKEIVPVSARTNEGLDELLKAVFSYLPYGDPFYDEDTVTNETLRDLVTEIIRQSALRKLSDEVPHGVAVIVESMKEKRDLWVIRADIYCERDSHKGIIIGKKGAMLKEIGSDARRESEKLLEKKVMLDLFVKVRKDWRENKSMLKRFGYKQ